MTELVKDGVLANLKAGVHSDWKPESREARHLLNGWSWPVLYDESRKAFQKQAIVGEGMQALDEEALRAFFDQDVTERAVRKKTAGRKNLAQSVGFVGFGKLLMNDPEKLRRHLFDFELSLIADIVAKLDQSGAFLAKRLRTNLTSYREQLRR